MLREPEMMNVSEKTLFSRHNNTVTHMNSQTVAMYKRLIQALT